MKKYKLKKPEIVEAAHVSEFEKIDYRYLLWTDKNIEKDGFFVFKGDGNPFHFYFTKEEFEALYEPIEEVE